MLPAQFAQMLCWALPCSNAHQLSVALYFAEADIAAPFQVFYCLTQSHLICEKLPGNACRLNLACTSRPQSYVLGLKDSVLLQSPVLAAKS